MAINKYCHPKMQDGCKQKDKGVCPVIDENDIILLCSLINEHGIDTEAFKKAVYDNAHDLETYPEIILEALEICKHVRNCAINYFDNIACACHFGFDGSDQRPDPDHKTDPPMEKYIPGENSKKTIH